MTDHSAATVAGITPGPGWETRARRHRRLPGHDHRHGLVGPGRHGRAVAGCLGGGDRLRQRADLDPHRHPDADHCQRLPAAEPVEGEHRRVLRVGRPGDQPLSRLPDRLADDRRLHHRDGGRGAPARPVGARRVRLQFHEHLGLRGHRLRGGPDHAGDRRGRYQDHGPGPGQHGPGGVPDPDRPGDRRPGVRAGPPPRLGADHQGLVQPVRRQRQGRRGGRVPGRGVRLRRLGRHPVRQRGSQAPPGEPGPRRHPRRRPAHHHLHAVAGRIPGRPLAGQAPAGRRTTAPRWSPWPRCWAGGSGPRRWRCPSPCP